MPNETYKPVRLSLMAASREFGISRTPLKTKLSDTSAGEDGCYSILQIVNALHTSSKGLKDNEVKARTLYWELRNDAARGALLDRKAVEAALSAVASAIRGVIKGSSLPRRDQEDVLKEIETATRSLEVQAKKQRREFGLGIRKSEAQKPGEEEE